MTTLQKLRSWINWSLVKSSLKGSVVDESKFIRLLWTCSRFDLSPFWPYPSNCYSQNGVTVTVYCHDLLKSTFTVTSTIDMRYYTSFTNKQFWTIKHKLENENVNNSWTVHYFRANQLPGRGTGSTPVEDAEIDLSPNSTWLVTSRHNALPRPCILA